MHECRYCGAPVDRRIGHCLYCRSRVELDLHGSLNYRLYEPESKRMCPNCDIPLSTVDLKIDKKCLIEKCEKCKGLFFDPGELELVLDKSVSNIFHVDDRKLKELQNNHFQKRQKEFRYRKCPCCSVMMNRESFGYKSGVIVDRCKTHGYWLDEGELRQLQEWKKAGGELRQEKLNMDSRGKPKSDRSSTPEAAQQRSFTSKYDRNEPTAASSFGLLDLISDFFD